MNKTPNYRFATEKPDHIMVSISGDAKTSMTITWRSCLDVAEGYVEYYEKDGEKKRCDAIVKPFKSDVNTSNIFWATPSNLKAGTRYYYTCGSNENRSEEYWFDTEEENLTKFKFIAISDHQKDDDHYNPDYSTLNKFLKDTLSKYPDVKFILTAGDNTNCGQHEIQWNAMFEGMKGIMEHLPYMMTCGNHDNRGFEHYFPNEVNRYYAEPAEFFNTQLEYSYPKNGPEGWQTEIYSFDYGNVHFNVFGVNEPELMNEWAKEDIAKSNKTWKLGVQHFPVYYAGPNLANDDTYPMMRESMEMLDVLFSGHEHNFSRSFPIKNEELFDKPSQGTVHYELGNANFNPPGTKTTDKVWHASFYPHEEQVASFALVEVDGDKITMISELNDGRIIDEFSIDKSKDEIRPHRVAPIFGEGRTRVYYKGVDLGLCNMSTPAVCKDSEWYVAFATMIRFAGGEDIREKGKVTLKIYGNEATFTEGSNIAVTNKGDVDLGAEVFRGNEGQLYMPVDGACKAFGMKWAYAKRNNFITIEHVSENHPIVIQP
ncbi:MAG: metallophosphoesterase family protein [Clostridia bacterium]|nr:metallophosphoesterase family protein [Clostridia bacterium]